MTDVPYGEIALPARLPVTGRIVDGRLVLDLTPTPELERFGIVRASVLAYVLDAVAGISVDDDDDAWMLTTDLSLHMVPVPAPSLVSATAQIVRRGGRSVTLTVDLTGDDGELVATGAAGFARVPVRAGDPEKPIVPIERAVKLFHRTRVPITRPIREEAGIETVDAAAGVVTVEVTPELRNPNGTLQGAMVALVAEAAVEDALEARLGTPVVVTDLDLRYLARSEKGPITTRCRHLGDVVEVALTDTSAGRVTTLVYARAVTAPTG